MLEGVKKTKVQIHILLNLDKKIYLLKRKPENGQNTPVIEPIMK